MKQALPHSPCGRLRGTCRKPAVLPLPCPELGLPSFAPVSLPLAQGQGLGRQHRLTQGLPKVPPGEESRPILDPQCGVFCLLSIQILLKSVGVTRGPGWQGSLRAESSAPSFQLLRVQRVLSSRLSGQHFF